MRLTDVASAFFERCQSVLDHVGDAQRVLTEAKAARPGRCGSTRHRSSGPRSSRPSSSGTWRSTQASRSTYRSSSASSTLRAEGYDLAMRMGDVVDDTLVARRVGDVERVIVGAPKLWKSSGTPRAPRDLAKHPYLQFANCKDLFLVLHRGRRRTEVQPPVRLRSNDYGRAASRRVGRPRLRVAARVDLRWCIEARPLESRARALDRRHQPDPHRLRGRCIRAAKSGGVRRHAASQVAVLRWAGVSLFVRQYGRT